jgi:hypothetical protein
LELWLLQPVNQQLILPRAQTTSCDTPAYSSTTTPTKGASTSLERASRYSDLKHVKF